VISIVDYGLGNVRAFANVFHRLGITHRVARTTEEILSADKLILPGVGAFDHAMGCLDESGLRPALDEMVCGRGSPVLGVCVGMQIMASGSEEGETLGLCWIDGTVRELPAIDHDQPLRRPHMGWNDVRLVEDSSLFRGLEEDARFYFLHSYYFECAQQENVLAETSYGVTFACAVRSDNVYGVQYHPEKSHQFGVRLLQNFAEM